MDISWLPVMIVYNGTILLISDGLELTLLVRRVAYKRKHPIYYELVCNKSSVFSSNQCSLYFGFSPKPTWYQKKPPVSFVIIRYLVKLHFLKLNVKCIKATIDLALSSFQCKLSMSRLPTKTLLFKYKYVYSNLCDCCKSHDKITKHTLWECPVSKSLQSNLSYI